LPDESSSVLSFALSLESNLISFFQTRIWAMLVGGYWF